MSYTPTDWKSGDTITSEKLNKMEQGIADAGGTSGGGVLYVGITDVDGVDTLTKTWQEIWDACENGCFVFCNSIQEMPIGTTCVINYVDQVSHFEEEYTVSITDGSGFACSSPDDYPIITST